MSYKAKIFTREEFREVVAAAIYDYEQAPAKCLYTTKDAADHSTASTARKPRWRNETTSV